MDKALFFQVSQVAESNPDQGLNLSNQVSDPVFRTLALVLLAPTTKDKFESRQWILHANETFSTMSDSLLKLQLITAIMKSDINMGEAELVRAILPQAFSLGKRIYQADHLQHPESPSYQINAADSLAEIVYAKGQVDEERIEGFIQDSPDTILQARLLGSAARGLAGMNNRSYLPV